MARAASIIVACCLLLSAPAPARAMDTPAARCAVPEEFQFSRHGLARFAERVKQKDRLVVVVLGSGSSMERGAAGLPRSYAAGIDDRLQMVFPGKTFEVRNLSLPGQTSADMVRRLATEIVPAKPDLVIWQAGAVDAARNVDINSFAASLGEGLKRLHAAGIDVILVGPQYRQRLAMMVDAEPFDDILSQVADREHAPQFRRYDIMRHWTQEATFDVWAADQQRQLSEAEAQDRCVADFLVAMIRDAAARAQ